MRFAPALVGGSPIDVIRARVPFGGRWASMDLCGSRSEGEGEEDGSSGDADAGIESKLLQKEREGLKSARMPLMGSGGREGGGGA